MQFRKTATALTLSAAVLMGAGVPAATAQTTAPATPTATTQTTSPAPAEREEQPRDEDNGDWGLWGLLGLLGLGGLLGRKKKHETPVRQQPAHETHRVDTDTHRVDHNTTTNHTDGRVTDATDRLRGTDGQRGDGIPGNGR